MIRLTPRGALLMLAALSLSGCWHASGKQAMVAQATQRLERLEAKQGSIERLLEAAEETRDDLVQQLQSMGVTSSTGLKGNAKARTLAATLEKTVREINGYERDSARFTEALVQTQALLRRLERAQTLEEAGLSDQELATLTETNLALDEAAGGGAPITTDPLQQEALLHQELARQPTKKTRPGSLAKTIVGRWTPVGSHWSTPPQIEFTTGGKAVVNDRLVVAYTISGRAMTLSRSASSDEYHEWRVFVLDAEILSPDEMIWSVKGTVPPHLDLELEQFIGKVRRVQ